MSGLRVLITNTTLATRTGTETYVRDLACGLLRRGHAPVVYSPETGEIARELREATVPVVDDLRAVAVAPDCIHGNQSAELMTALLHFPGVPGVFFCHSWIGWANEPPRFPRVLRCVAVDDTCRDRLSSEHGVPEDRLRVLLNAVDLERFRPRAPLPPRPRRALVFSNTANDSTHLAAVREACARAGIALDVVGAEANNSTSRPELLLGQYDLIFAKARCALESMAVGAAVVLCDMYGSGPLVTAGEFDRLRRLNFGMRSLDRPINADVLAAEIARYDAADAAEVSRRVRASAGVDSLVDEIVELYREVIAEHARGGGAHDALAEAHAAAAFVRAVGLAAKRECAEFRAELLADSLTLRLRNQMPRFPLLERAVRGLARSARRRGL